MNKLYQLTVIKNVGELKDIKSEWETLTRLAGPEALFCSHTAIMENWRLHALDSRRKLHIVCIRRGGVLVLAAPMIMVYEWFGTRVLYWLDSKTPIYADFLMARWDKSAADLFAGHLQRLPMLRKVKANCVLKNSYLARFFTMYNATNLHHSSASSVTFPPIFTAADFFSRSRNTRQKYRYYLNRLNKGCVAKFELVEDREQMRSVISWIFSRKRDWVLEKFDGPNWLSPPEIEEYFQNVSTKLASKGQAWCLKLSCGDQCVAAVLCFENKKKVFASKMTFDPHWRNFRPGWLLLCEMQRTALDRDCRTIDFMIGEEDWKDRAANSKCEVSSYRLSFEPWKFWRKKYDRS